MRCAPPGNKPTPTSGPPAGTGWTGTSSSSPRAALDARPRVAIGWDAALSSARRLGWAVPRPKPKFGHGAETVLVTADGHEVRLLGSYHVSQQNTFTGKLTEKMLDAVIARL